VTDPVSAEYRGVQERALVGGRSLALRYVLVGLLSLGGSTFLIRSLGANAWATYSVAYFLITFVDQNIGARLLGSIVRWPGAPPVRMLQAAGALMQALGAGLLLLFLAVALPADGLSSLADLGLCLAAVGVCAYVYALRTLPLVLLERALEYRWIAIGEVLDQITFYVVAVPLVLSHEGLRGVAVALAVRGIPTAVLLRLRSRAPLVGRPLRAEIGELLHFAVPTLGAAGFILVEGLMPLLVLGGEHARALAFFMTSSSLIGYAAVVQVVVQRVGFPSFNLVRGAGGQLARAVKRTNGAALFVLTSMVVPMAGFSPLWLPLLFGSDWKPASISMVAIGAGFVLFGSISVLSGALYTLGHPRDVLRAYAVMTLIYGGLAVVGAHLSVLAGVGIAYAVSRAFGLALLGFDVARRGCPVPMARMAGVVGFAIMVATLLATATWHHQWLAATVVAALALPLWARGFALNRGWLIRAIGRGTSSKPAAAP